MVGITDSWTRGGDGGGLRAARRGGRPRANSLQIKYLVDRTALYLFRRDSSRTVINEINLINAIVHSNNNTGPSFTSKIFYIKTLASVNVNVSYLQP